MTTRVEVTLLNSTDFGGVKLELSFNFLFESAGGHRDSGRGVETWRAEEPCVLELQFGGTEGHLMFLECTMLQQDIGAVPG